MASGDRTRTGDGIDLPVGMRDSTGSRPARNGVTIGELARETGVTVRALRFYQSKGLLGLGGTRVFSQTDRDRLALILQGKRLGFTLKEIRELLPAHASHGAKALPIGRRKCVDQINLLERQRRDIDQAIAELRRIYTEMFTGAGAAKPARIPGTR
jgi:DNA-binding transcriptional MerR regulator